MPPRKELCRNFQRGRYLHSSQQQPKLNFVGFGGQVGSQFPQGGTQQQKPNPFGFGVQSNSQTRGANDFGSRQQNQFKPFQNKWTRNPPTAAGGSPALRQPGTQSQPPNHKCTDPESCKRIIVEDFEQERPLWKLSCYAHCRSSPCDIVGDVSYEELRAAAYDDAMRGLSLQSIVERERSLLNSKLVEYENLHSNPYVIPSNSKIASFGASVNAPSWAQTGGPPSTSAGQPGTSVNFSFGARQACNTLSWPSGQDNSSVQSPFSQNTNQISGAFGTSSSGAQPLLPFGAQSPQPFGAQPPQPFGAQPPQPFGALSNWNAANFGNSVANAETNKIFSSASVSPQISTKQSPGFSIGQNPISSAVEQTASTSSVNSMPSEVIAGDVSIWLKEKWHPGEIPEVEPP
ncbi:hypothetical protein RJ641_025720, partial [Dillenia turbinata]